VGARGGARQRVSRLGGEQMEQVAQTARIGFLGDVPAFLARWATVER
jgi:hypothetical protein